MTKILHGCLDRIRTVPSNQKIMLIVENMLGQETLYSTHSSKSGYYNQFAFFSRMYIIVIVMVVISWSDHNSQQILWTDFLTETDYLMSEVECNFFAEPLLCTWWLHFQENIFVLGPKSVSIFSCNTTTGFSFGNFVRNIFYWRILCFISNWMLPRFIIPS